MATRPSHGEPATDAARIAGTTGGTPDAFLRSLFPGMGAAVPAQQRSRNKPELVYPRPGIPTVHGARAAAALEGGDRHSVAEAFVGLVTRPWGREKPDASGATTDDRLYADLRQNFLSRYDSVPQAVVV
jgi:hypothetical protein